MKTFVLPGLAALAILAAYVPTASAEPVKHAVPVATSAECAAAQQQARKSPTGTPRIVYSSCRTNESLSRNSEEAHTKAGLPI